MTRPRKFTAEFKARVVLELLIGSKSVAEASREYAIKDSVLSRWRQEFIERAPRLFQPEQGDNADDKRIAELERLAGRLAMELEMAKKVSRHFS
jgi:transposase